MKVLQKLILQLKVETAGRPKPKLVVRRLALGMVVAAVAGAVLCAQTSPLPPEAAEKFRQAADAMRNGNLEAAGEGFAEVVKQAPGFAEGYMNLGLVREEQGRHADAIPVFQKALQLKPALRGANLFLGIAQYRSNRLDAALVSVRKEAAAYPKDATAWMWVGIVELEKGSAEEAADALDKAAKLAPDNADIFYHRGRAHLAVSKDSYSRMFQLDPKSWRVRELMAEANADAERHVDAIAEYQEAIKLAPNEPRLHEELGTEYRNAGKMQEAEEAFRKELEIDPDNGVAEYKLGVLLTEKGDAAQGKQYIEAAIRTRPGLRHADYNLGRAEMLLGNDTAAAEHFQRATHTDTDPDVLQQAWYQLGTVLRRMHRTQEAQQAFAMFQRFKDQQLESAQKQLKQFQRQEDADTVAPSPTPDQPGNQ
jgi:tetratricopeptide (TPR) repeat protein